MFFFKHFDHQAFNLIIAISKNKFFSSLIPPEVVRKYMKMWIYGEATV